MASAGADPRFVSADWASAARLAATVGLTMNAPSVVSSVLNALQHELRDLPRVRRSRAVRKTEKFQPEPLLLPQPEEMSTNAGPPKQHLLDQGRLALQGSRA